MWLPKKISQKIYRYAVKQHALKRRKAKNKCRLLDAFMGKEYCALAWAFYITDNKNK